MNKRINFQKGMTIIEILIALTILSLSILTGLQLMSFVSVRTIEDFEKVHATLLMDEISTEVKIGYIFPRNQKAEKTIGSRKFIYEIEVDTVSVKNKIVVNIKIKNENGQTLSENDILVEQTITL